MIHNSVRVRFAPSPTGYLHVGGLRTALYNYLFARANNGSFVLRIEDTDRARYVEGAVENLIDTLEWSGLIYDEGPGKDGGYGPYIQSERLDIYKKEVQSLVEKGKAYYCFCSQERLKTLREEQDKNKIQPRYDKHCLSLSTEEIEAKLNSGASYVIRLNVFPGQKVLISDIIRGEVEFDTDTIDDQVLLKSDGYPTYHLANVVDDHYMKITHVIRGEEWLSSTPKHKLLYDYFGWEVPVFAHLPLLLNPDKSKLSKRQGDVAVEDYRKKGFLKEALVNFVALLGWTAGDDKEFYYLNELIQAFRLERVNKSGAVFDIAKLQWLNAEHLRAKPVEEILPALRNHLQETEFKNGNYSDAYLLKVIEAMLPRVEFVHEITSKGFYFFTRPESYEPDAVQKRWKSSTPEHLKAIAEKFQQLADDNKESFEHALHETAAFFGIKNAELIHPLRLAISGVSGGPGLYDICSILGRDETSTRIHLAIERIK